MEDKIELLEQPNTSDRDPKWHEVIRLPSKQELSKSRFSTKAIHQKKKASPALINPTMQFLTVKPVSINPKLYQKQASSDTLECEGGDGESDFSRNMKNRAIINEPGLVGYRRMDNARYLDTGSYQDSQN